MSSYLGNLPSNNFVSLKRQVISGNGGASYTLDYSVASVNDVAIFVNNVRQDPASYSISGTALTLGGTISSSDSCYIIFLGQGIQSVKPANNTITNAMLSETITVANGGTGLTSGFANGITMADAYRLTANTNTGTNAVISSNWERVDEATFGRIGTGLTESSGVFSFPSTGIYLIHANIGVIQDSSDSVSNVIMEGTTDNSSYDDVAMIRVQNAGTEQYGWSLSSFFDVTDTSNVKFRFETTSFTSTTAVKGDTNLNRTVFFCVRLGDT